MLLYYIIVFLAGFISGFINVSQGSWFMKQSVKGISLVIAILILIVMCVLTIVNYRWLHILGLIAIWIIAAQLAAFILLRNKRP
jgi:hypothetical protein